MTGRAAWHNVTAPAHVGATEPSGGAQPRTQATQGTPLFVNFFSLSSWDLSRKRKETTFFLLRPLRSFVVTEPLDEHRVHGNGVRLQRAMEVKGASSRSGVPHIFCPQYSASAKPPCFKPVEVPHATRTSSVRIRFRWLLRRFMLGHACRHQGRVKTTVKIAANHVERKSP